MDAANGVRDGNGAEAAETAEAEAAGAGEEAEVRLNGEICDIKDLVNPPEGSIVYLSPKAAQRMQVQRP